MHPVLSHCTVSWHAHWLLCTSQAVFVQSVCLWNTCHPVHSTWVAQTWQMLPHGALTHCPCGESNGVRQHHKLLWDLVEALFFFFPLFSHLLHCEPGLVLLAWKPTKKSKATMIEIPQLGYNYWETSTAPWRVRGRGMTPMVNFTCDVDGGQKGETQMDFFEGTAWSSVQDMAFEQSLPENLAPLSGCGQNWKDAGQVQHRWFAMIPDEGGFPMMSCVVPSHWNRVRRRQVLWGLWCGVKTTLKKKQEQARLMMMMMMMVVGVLNFCGCAEYSAQWKLGRFWEFMDLRIQCVVLAGPWF